MERLKVEDILKPGAQMFVGVVDFNDPRVIALFEDTKKRQEELTRLRDQPFENLLITI